MASLFRTASNVKGNTNSTHTQLPPIERDQKVAPSAGGSTKMCTAPYGSATPEKASRQSQPTKGERTRSPVHNRTTATSATTTTHNSHQQSGMPTPSYSFGKGQEYKPNYYPPMPKGCESPSTLPSLLPIRQLECPPPSRSLAEQMTDVSGGSIEGKLCRNITLTRVEIRNSYLVNCTLVNCISKGCYFTSTKIQASDIVHAPCVISCALEDSFISLSILSNCRMLQGAVKESRIMDCDVEAAGVFYCRMTRSVFFQCEYKEIEQVDCDLKECDGDGDVDAFFPIVAPKQQQQVIQQVQMLQQQQKKVQEQQHKTGELSRTPSKGDLINHPVPALPRTTSTLREESKNATAATTPTQSQPPNKIPPIVPPQRPQTQPQPNPQAFQRARSSGALKPNSGLSPQAPPTPTASSPLNNTNNGRSQPVNDHIASPGSNHASPTNNANTPDGADAFNRYYRQQQNGTNPENVAVHEPKVGGRARRGSLFCCQ